MRKSLLFMAMISLLAIVSCEKDEAIPSGGLKNITIKASISWDNPETRVALGETTGDKTKVEWCEGDAFSLAVGEKDYLFEWVSGNEFAYDGENGDFPATFETAGTVTATYPAAGAAGLSEQSGLKTDVGNYMQLDASLEVAAGLAAEGLSLTFGHRTSVVEIALECPDMAGKDVVVDLRTTKEVLYSAPMEDEVLNFGNDGKMTLYFAVAPTDAAIPDWKIGLWDVAASKYQTASLSAIQLAAGKLYKVSKGAGDLKLSYEISGGANMKVTAYDAVGLYDWSKRATANPTNLIVDLELGADVTLPTDGITLTDGLPDKGNWVPVQGGSTSATMYKGSIDGKNHTIKNMYIVDKTMATCHGFIGNSGKVTIKDLKFDGAKIVVGDATANDGGGYTGVISGSSRSDLDNCHVTNSIVKCLGHGYSSNRIGGLVGSFNGNKITNSSFSGTIEGYEKVGGIAGNQAKDTEIGSCSASGTVKATRYVGGIVGEANGLVVLCTNEATVTGTSSGGIAGNLSDHMGTYASCIMGCTNKGKINGTSGSAGTGTGGIVGRVLSYYNGYSFIIGCRNLSKEVYIINSDGSVYGNHVAGVVGIFNGTKTPTGVYGSYTVSMTEVAGILYNSKTVGSVISGSTAVNNSDGFVFASEADLTNDKITAMNSYIETGVTAATDKKIINNTYNDYRWSWTSGSWPVFDSQAVLD